MTLLDAPAARGPQAASPSHRTRRRVAAAIVAIVAAGLASPAAAKPSARKPRLAILDFPAASDAWACSGWSNSEGRMSRVLRDLFTSELSDEADGRIALVERERLNDVRGELSLQQGGEVDPATAMRIGKLLGARFMLTGRITRFACKKRNASSGWGLGALVGKVTGSDLAGRVAGSVNAANVSFSGRLDARLIDVKTGEILAAFKKDNDTGDLSVKIAGGGSDVEYDDELASKVYEPIVHDMAPGIVKKVVQAGKDVAAEDEADQAEAAAARASGGGTNGGGTNGGATNGDGASGRSARVAQDGGAGAAGGAQAVQVYGNDFDFVPGDTVLFYDDFTDTDVGDSPMKWRGAGLSVVEAMGRRWVTGPCKWQQVRYQVKGDLPKKFTVEYDVLLPSKWTRTQFWIDSGVSKYGIEPGRTGVAGDDRDAKYAPGVHHVSLSFNDTYVKMYVDGKRVGQNTDGLVRPVKVFGICLEGEQNAPGPLVTNFTLAEGGKDYATELTTGRIVTHGITFDSGSDVIRPESGPTLRKILKLMQDDAALAFEVQGHTDAQGGDRVNGPLSERRAAAVKAWLVSQGIDGGRLSSKGLGSSKPLKPNDTPEGRAENRRVEFVKRGA